MINLDALAERVRDAIPLTRHLDFRFAEFDGLSLTVTAPLALNHNDKGTFFAGSQSALLTLAGWGLTTLLAQQSGHPADVVAVETSLEYKRPLDADLQIIASINEEERQRFAQHLTRRGKATLRVHAQGIGTGTDGKVVCLYQGRYLART